MATRSCRQPFEIVLDKKPFCFRLPIFTVPGRPITDIPNGILFHWEPAGSRFAATIEAVYPNGQLSGQSPEIFFSIRPNKNPSIDIPHDFLAKILWANTSAWIRHNLL